MSEFESTIHDEYELPKNRKKRILSDLDELEMGSNALIPIPIKEKKDDSDECEDTALFISTLSSLSKNKMRASKSPKNLFGKGKKKDKKKKKKGEPTDFNKEFEPEMALLNNLLAEQSRFVDSLQQKYDRMDSQKSSARGMGKFTTDLISNINQARQLSAQLIDKKISTKKTIADLEMKERKEMGSLSSDDMNNFAAEYLKNIITNRPDMSSSYGNISIEDVDDDGILSAIDSNFDDERGDEVSAYLKYENRNVTIKVIMNPDDLDDYEFVAETDDGEILTDYPLPDHTTLSLNRSTMIATDAYGKKYHVEFRDS